MEAKIKEMIRNFEMSDDPYKDGEEFCQKVTETLMAAGIYENSRWVARTVCNDPGYYAKAFAYAWTDECGLHLVEWLAENC